MRGYDQGLLGTHWKLFLEFPFFERVWYIPSRVTFNVTDKTSPVFYSLYVCDRLVQIQGKSVVDSLANAIRSTRLQRLELRDVRTDKDFIGILTDAVVDAVDIEMLWISNRFHTHRAMNWHCLFL